MQLLQQAVTEASADVASVMPFLAITHRNDQRPEVFPRAPRRREADDHHFLSAPGFDLEPILAARAREIGAGRALGHDALFSAALCLFEEAFAVGFAVCAVSEQRMLRNDRSQPLLSLDQRQ